MAGHPTQHVSVIKSKEEIMWTGGLPHISELPHQTGVPHLHVNRQLESRLRQTAYVSSKLTISQSRKYAEKRYAQ